MTDLFFRFDWLIVLSTYMTVLLSVYFPLLILFPATRLFAVLAMAAFHVGIAVMMGLTSFALIMIACDLIFVDKHIWSLRRRVSTLVGRASRRFQSPETSPSPPRTAVDEQDGALTPSAPAVPSTQKDKADV